MATQLSVTFRKHFFSYTNGGYHYASCAHNLLHYTRRQLNDVPYVLVVCNMCVTSATVFNFECEFVKYDDVASYLAINCLQAVGRWIRSCPMHFDANAQLCKMIDRLQKMVLADGFGHQFASLLDVSSVYVVSVICFNSSDYS